ncbi:hypothetical protein [Rhizobium sp. Leaf311]|uniref:hypothetical protein n=1 Tax=Rhizobium sp. Leaf311 TaxID=1736332 RepID=UPI000A99395E|nr:hypothetical protein [Rhizobium sp. Leaf311]
MTTAFSYIMTTILSSGAPFAARTSLSTFLGRTSSSMGASAHRRRRRWQPATIGGLHAEHQEPNSSVCVSA